MTDRVWYYRKNEGEQTGPYSDEELVGLLQNGTVSGDDMIWMEDLKNWLKVSDSIYGIFLPRT